MKKKPTEANRTERLQDVVDYLTNNGVTEFNADIFIRTNLPALGGYRSITDEARDGKWDKVWDMAELYVSGDMW